MSILIALDDGHGMRTPGKRSPKLSDGTVMHENEFNRRVVALLNVELKRCGFRTLLVAPTDHDDPLEVRVARANKAKADFYLSVHANAFNGKLDDAAGGIETFAHFSYPNTVKKARVIHEWLMKGTKMKDRGVKNGDWLYVCKHTNMEAALVELGFMDNIDDIKKLLSEVYRKECAVELAKALCEIYKVKYIPETKPAPAPKPSQKPKEEDDMLEKAIVINGFADFPVAERLALKLKAPVYLRSIVKGQKVAKALFVVGGTKEGMVADKVTLLSGADRFETAAAVAEFLK